MLGRALINILSIKFKILRKYLFIGMNFVFDVTPPEFKKIKHSVNSSCSIFNKSPNFSLNYFLSSKMR